MKLRRKTGYSFVNCKKALEACDGDLKQVGGGAVPPGARPLLFFRGHSGEHKVSLTIEPKEKNLA